MTKWVRCDKPPDTDRLGADFTGSNLKDADLKSAWYDVSTRWPKGFDPTAVGARSAE